MPRPVPPPPISPLPKPEAFRLEPDAKARIAKTLGVAELSPENVSCLEALLSCYLATKNGAHDTTPKNVIAAIDEVDRKIVPLRKALNTFLIHNSSLDDVSFNALREHASSIFRAIEVFSGEYNNQRIRLCGLRRVNTTSEPRRYFCSTLAEFFRQFFANRDIESDEALKLRRAFSLEMLMAAGDEVSQYAEHPGRLEELLDSALFSDEPTSER